MNIKYLFCIALLFLGTTFCGKQKEMKASRKKEDTLHHPLSKEIIKSLTKLAIRIKNVDVLHPHAKQRINSIQNQLDKTKQNIKKLDEIEQFLREQIIKTEVTQDVHLLLMERQKIN